MGNGSLPQAAAIVARVPIQPLLAFHRPAPPLLLLVLALHVVLLLALANLGTWRDRAPQVAERAPLQVWLLDAFKPWPQPGAEVAKPTAPIKRQTTVLRPTATTEPTQAITVPAAEPGPAPAPAAAPDTTPALTLPAATPSPQAPPLNLALPRGASAPWRSVNPALDDRSARGPRATFEGRLARELGGDGVWVEERLGTDAVRFRRGGTCVDVERGRSDQLDAFNRNSSLKPWVVKQARPC